MNIKVTGADINVLASRLSAVVDDAYEKGVQAERERICDIIKAVGMQGNHNELFECCETILERIDAAL